VATSFLTQLTQISYDAEFTETGSIGNLNVPVYAPNHDIYKFEPITDPGLKSKARNDANRRGALWAEFNFYVELVGFSTYEDGGTKYNPPYWGRICKALGMKPTGTSGSPAWSYEVVDEIHLNTDTVHTSNYLNPLTMLVDHDGYKFILKNAVGNGTFSWDVDAGPPRLTVDSFMGNIYEDASGGFLYYPTTDDPYDFGDQKGGADAVTTAAPSATDCTAATATFQADGVAVGDIAYNVTTGEQALVTVIVSETELTTESITSLWTATDSVEVYTGRVDIEIPTATDTNITLALSVIPNDGTYTPVAITGTCPKSWLHNLGNAIIEQRCAEEDYKLGQFLAANQNANTATLVIKVADPGTGATPASFNPYKMVENRDMLDFSSIHNDGSTNLDQITFICDYYISEVVGVADDGNGVLTYTLTLQQASLQPDGTAAQYFKVSLA
jgi:hypothetical protein